MRNRTRSSLGIAGALGALAVAVAAQGATDEKVLVCHGTASETNPYVLIEVSESALNGHFDIVDDLFVPTGHGKQNAPDFLLIAPYTTCEEQLEDEDGGGSDDD